MAITETWLKPTITDACVQIKNYNIFRSDRESALRGGVLLYIHQNISIDTTDCFDDGVCEGVICLSKARKCIISCIYRPPSATQNSFDNLLKFLTQFITKHNVLDKMNTFIFGDFNIPNFQCESQNSYCPIGFTNSLTDFMRDHFLEQFVREGTRGNNLLDLFLSDDPDFVKYVKVRDTDMSDHKIIYIYNSFFQKSILKPPILIKENPELNFSQLNLNTANFQNINRDISKVNWKHIFSKTDINEIPTVFHNIVYSILEKHCKYRLLDKSKLNRFKRKRNTISRKLRKFKARKQMLIQNQGNPTSIIKLNVKIEKLVQCYKESFFEEKHFEEHKAVNRIKSDNRYFFKYANKFKHTPFTPSLLLDKQDNEITDPKEIADALQDHFKSVFTASNNLSENITDCINPEINFPLPDLIIENEDVIAAINEIKSSASSPPYDIPIKVLKECKKTLCLPIKLLWEKSFSLGVIPSIYKSQVIIPIHKKGPKTKVQNFRPISLTPHIIKIFERILRKKLNTHFEVNILINSNQHGFRDKLSCSTQLLTHTNNILSNFVQDCEVDSVYVDYAKAFDRVDHSLLIKKITSIWNKG